MGESETYLLKVDAVAGEGCRYAPGRPMRLLVVCRAASSSEASEIALTPLALAGWTRPQLLSCAPLAADPERLAGVPGQATRYALANGYAIVAYP